MCQRTKLPKYWDILSNEDQKEYLILREEIEKAILLSGRAKFCTVFQDVVMRIKRYVNREERDKEKRSLICGIVWMGKIIAINTHQLITTIGKCKSSVNNGFQAIGFSTIPMTSEIAVTLVKMYPFMKNCVNETRQWTCRVYSGKPRITQIQIGLNNGSESVVCLFKDHEYNFVNDLAVISNELFNSVTLDTYNDEDFSIHNDDVIFL